MTALLIVALLAGILGWTLTEYTLHRFLFHAKKAHTEGAREHLRHHKDINHFTTTAFKVRTVVTVLPVVGTLGVLLLGWEIAGAFSVSFLSTYLGYEWFHRRIHVQGPSTRFGRWARMHHFGHHFHVPHLNHGVTMPGWDKVFGTYEEMTRVILPNRQVIPWLMDSETGEILPEYRDDYDLRKNQ